MTLLAIGVTHRSASLDVLDEIAIDPAGAQRLAVEAVHSPRVSEALVIATCNRLEILADVTAFHSSSQDLADILAKASGAEKAELLQALHISYGDQAARHLFEVAAGLDSMVVGEQQIVGQVRDALLQAQELGTAGRRLNGVTQSALRAAKSVHTRTGIARHGASVASVGLDAALQHVPHDVSEAVVVIVGAGAMAALAVAALQQAGAADVTIVNRTPERARSTASGTVARTAPFAELPLLLATADLIICCTGSTDVILKAAEVAAVRIGNERPLTVLDLAMPHDTDPRLALVPGVTRIGLPDLVGGPRTAATEEDAAAARRILDEELAAYFSAEAERRLDPLVVSLRARAGEHVSAEADRIRARLPHLSPQDLMEIEHALRRAVNGLLHTPTVRVKQLASEPDGRRFADALHSLFDLPADVIEALGTPEGADEEGRW